MPSLWFLTYNQVSLLFPSWSTSSPGHRCSSMRPEKQVVRDFYDLYGWKKSADGVYKDTSAFVDRRPVLDGYRHRTHMRVSKFLLAQGEYFLDAGCGAIPHREYLEYSRGYRHRVCVDLSEKALKEARAKLGDHGLYVVADVTNLPFANHTIDGAVSAHVLYHVPYDEQEAGVRELYRTLARGRVGVIIYTWPDYWYSWLRRCYVWLCMLFGKLPGIRGAWNVIRMIAGKHRQAAGNDQCVTGDERPPLYFRPHDRRWFRQTFGAKVSMEIRAWRSVDRLFTERMIPDNSFGRFLLAVIFRCEDLFPHLLGRIGRYPLIILRK